MSLSFIGLGQMGKPMAINLLKSGEDLIVFNRRAHHFLEFQGKGARVTRDLSDVAMADIIFLCLPDHHVVNEVLFGEKGIFDRLIKGQIIVDLSTIDYLRTIEIAEILKKRGVGYLDAPVTGMDARATEGSLTVMCGGKEKVFEAVKPYLRFIGNNIIYMGKSGNGQLAKLINQLLFDINAASIAEILPMSIKLGLDPEKMTQIINSGSGKSFASEFFLPRVLKNQFVDGYPMKKAYKDLLSAAEISAKLCIPTPVLHSATTTYQMALLSGHGEKDKGGMICVFEELLGVKFRS